MQAMTRFPTLFLSVVAAALPGCTTSFWYTAVQGAAYERCESIQDAAERSRCKSANYPDEEKYKKERSPAGSHLNFCSLRRMNAALLPSSSTDTMLSSLISVTDQNSCGLPTAWLPTTSP